MSNFFCLYDTQNTQKRREYEIIKRDTSNNEACQAWKAKPAYGKHNTLSMSVKHTKVCYAINTLSVSVRHTKCVKLQTHLAC